MAHISTISYRQYNIEYMVKADTDIMKVIVTEIILAI